jgi:hypothetical protein
MTIFKGMTPDRRPPDVAFNLFEGQIISGSVNLTATVTDNVAVAGVQFKIDGVNYGSEDTSFPYTISLDTHTLTNGIHAITVVARDNVGNSRTVTANVTVNNVFPSGGSLSIGNYLDGDRYFIRDASNKQDVGSPATLPANPDSTHYQLQLAAYVGTAETNVGETHVVGLYVNGVETIDWVNPPGTNNQGLTNVNGGETVSAKRWSTTSDNFFTAKTLDVRAVYSYALKSGYLS